MEKINYLDNASTTKVFDEVFDIMKQNNSELFFNPSAAYKPSIMARKKLDEARNEISNLIYGNGGKIYFTSSATESNNTVFNGVHIREGQVVLISSTEHPSVYNAAKTLEKRNIKVIEIPVLSNGKINEARFEELLKTENVAMVSIIHSSNETGTVNDIKKLCALTKKINPKIIFHSDGVQAFGKINVNVRELGVDLYTISAHKVYAPRGIACLWVKNGVLIDPLLYGGGQENGFRSSTENVAGAIGFAYSAKKVILQFEENLKRVLNLKHKFLEGLEKSKIAGLYKVNSIEDENPYIVSISFDKIKGEVLMYALEVDGVLISTGSACSSKKAGNKTLRAMGLSSSEIIGSVRISFSAYENYDMDYIISSFEKNVLRLEANVKR